MSGIDVLGLAVPFLCALFITNYIGYHFWLTHSNHARAAYAILIFVASFLGVSRLSYYALVAFASFLEKKFHK